MRPFSLRTLRLSLATLSCSLPTALVSCPAWAGSWTANVSYGGNMSADLYTPTTPADSPALIVSLHFCGGTKGNAQGWFLSDADALGYYIIAPQAGGNCFDAAAAKGGERGEIVAMVEWAIDNHGVDPGRVYAAGASSGACMTQALLAAYPEVFAAGSSLAGVPAGAWTGGNEYGFNTPNQSAEAWGDVVRNLNPGYTGPWPRMQIWHGQGDTNLTYSSNWPAETGQWTNVWGFTEADGMNESIQPPGAQDTWNRASYTTSMGLLAVETNNVAGVPHDLTGRGLWGDVVRFFAPDVDPPDPTEGSGGMDGAGGGIGESAGGSDGAGGAVGAGGAGSSSAGGAVGVGGGGNSSAGGAIGAGGGTTSAGGSGVTPSTGGAAIGGTSSSSSGGSSTGDDAGMGDDSVDNGGCSYGAARTNGPSPSYWAGMFLMLSGLLIRRRKA